MKLHEEWLLKAGNDFESARILYDSGKPLFDVCVYHCHQCAEKSLKAICSLVPMRRNKLFATQPKY